MHKEILPEEEENPYEQHIKRMDKGHPQIEEVEDIERYKNKKGKVGENKTNGYKE